MNFDQYLLWMALAFIGLNIIVPLAAFFFWLLVKVPAPVRRLYNRLMKE